MNITKIFEWIIQSDPQDCWNRMEHKHADRAVFKEDVNLRIESDYESDVIVEDFKEEWANKHADPSATSKSYNVYYGGTLVTYVVLVAVDGGRALLPIPDFDTKAPTLLAFRIAEIINYKRLHEYMGRAGLKFPEGA